MQSLSGLSGYLRRSPDTYRVRLGYGFVTRPRGAPEGATPWQAVAELEWTTSDEATARPSTSYNAHHNILHCS